jgi:hypothetical protein
VRGELVGHLGGRVGGEITSPREMSISSASVSVTDWPATACAQVAAAVTMRATVLSRPDGCTRMRRPAHRAAGDQCRRSRGSRGSGG